MVHSSSLNEEAARKLIGLEADRRAQARVDKLARKCNEGELTAEERHEYQTYVLAGEFVAILQAEARLPCYSLQPITRAGLATQTPCIDSPFGDSLPFTTILSLGRRSRSAGTWGSRNVSIRSPF